MTSGVYSRSLRLLEKHLRPVLPRDSRSLLLDAANQVEGSSRGGRPWSLTISSARPLRFNSSEEDERIRPDIYCQIVCGDDRLPLKEHSVTLRVWSDAADLSFRENWDSIRVREKLEAVGVSSRVMMRMHFDRAPLAASEPLFHLQFGGLAQEAEREICWHPHKLSLPRIPFPPLDLVLACELVLANFFPSTYLEKRQESEWGSLVRHILDDVAKPYYEAIIGWWQLPNPDRRTLLDILWNT